LALDTGAQSGALSESHRVDHELMDALARASHPPKMLLSASAIGYYGDQGDRWVDEDTEPRMEYAHQLCEA
jgi:NAD dependent epimerase/dehydratase family enzyme